MESIKVEKRENDLIAIVAFAFKIKTTENDDEDNKPFSLTFDFKGTYEHSLTLNLDLKSSFVGNLIKEGIIDLDEENKGTLKMISNGQLTTKQVLSEFN